MKRKEAKGAITVFLCTVLILILSLLFTMAESARISAERAVVESVVDLGMYSAFGQYDREMLEKYEIFTLALSESGGLVEVQKLADSIDHFISYNINPGKELLSLNNFSLLNPKQINSDVVSYTLLTDNNGLAYKTQAVEYMKKHLGVQALEGIERKLDGSEKALQAQSEYQQQEKSNQQELLALEEDRREAEAQIEIEKQRMAEAQKKAEEEQRRVDEEKRREEQKE